MKLQIAKDLSLPLDAVTQTIAIVAKRRAGKSYTMRRLAEQLFMAGQQIVLVDPKGDQWGIRSSADAKGPGLPIVILGGERADVPLEASSGEVVAKLVVEERVSVLLDLSLFRKHEVATFMTAFLENLYRLKAKEVYRTPVMLVIDEADAVAPQKPQKGEERMLGAAEDIVRRGGQRGIGCVLVTQRSAVLNKNVLTQAQMLVALRTIAPQDLAAMDAWIQVHGDPEQRKTLMESLPSLPVGDAWFWSPGWPTVEGIFKRVHVLPIETFDSGATPKPGETRREPKTVADVDLNALKRQMSATIEKAKADDPRELRKQIAELRKEIAAQKCAKPEAPKRHTPKTIEKFVLKDGQLARAEQIAARAEQCADTLGKLEDRLSEIEEDFATIAKEIRDAIASTHAPSPESIAEFGRRFEAAAHQHNPTTTTQHRPSPASSQVRQPAEKVQRAAPLVSPSSNGNGSLPPARRKILNALAFLHGIGVHAVDKTQLALMSDVPPTSGGYKNNLGALRSDAFIEYPQPGTVALTDAGRLHADGTGLPQTTRQLHDAIRQKLPPAKWRILETLIGAYPESIDKEALAEACDVPSTSGGYKNNLGSLRSLGLVDYPRPGQVAAQRVLFLEG